MIKLLLTTGLDINEVDPKGRTPLFLTRSKTVITFLFEKGAQLDIQNNKGNTLLHEAVKQESLKRIKLLLSLGADPLIRNHKGRTVRELVQYLKNRRVYDDIDHDALMDAFDTLIAPYEIDDIKMAIDD